MTVQEKMKQVFGISFNPYHSKFQKGTCLNGIIDCIDVSCSSCPLNNQCDWRGVGEWLRSEYDGSERENKTLESEYQRGVEDGRKQAYEELSKIFRR